MWRQQRDTGTHWERWQSLGIMTMCHGISQPISAHPPRSIIFHSGLIFTALLWKCQSQLGNNDTSSVFNLLIGRRLLIVIIFTNGINLSENRSQAGDKVTLTRNLRYRYLGTAMVANIQCHLRSRNATSHHHLAFLILSICISRSRAWSWLKEVAKRTSEAIRFKCFKLLVTTQNVKECRVKICKVLAEHPSYFLHNQAKYVWRQPAWIQVLSISRGREAGHILMMASDKLFTMFGLEQDAPSDLVIHGKIYHFLFSEI